MSLKTKACLAKRDCACRHCGGQILLGHQVHYCEGGGFIHLNCVAKFRRANKESPMPVESKIPPKAKPVEMTEERYLELCECYGGVCLSCHEATEGDVEPDACNYPCDACNLPFVFGAEELMMMGMIELVDE